MIFSGQKLPNFWVDETPWSSENRKVTEDQMAFQIRMLLKRHQEAALALLMSRCGAHCLTPHIWIFLRLLCQLGHPLVSIRYGYLKWIMDSVSVTFPSLEWNAWQLQLKEESLTSTHIFRGFQSRVGWLQDRTLVWEGFGGAQRLSSWQPGSAAGEQCHSGRDQS